jgi:hypothetical protein
MPTDINFCKSLFLKINKSYTHNQNGYSVIPSKANKNA